MTEDQLLQEIRAAFDADQEAWREIRAEGDKDMLCVAGDIWEAMDPAGKKQREDAKRPILSFDELSQYTNQLINEVRSNKRGIKVTPIGYGANDQTAQYRQDRIRQIEYRSNAQQAYTTMFENAVHRGYGFLRVRAKYVSVPDPENPQPSDFDQELLIEPNVNPNLITPDARSVRPDGADMKRCTIYEVMTIDEFKREYPGAKVQNFTGEHRTTAPNWVKEQEIVIAEHWRIDVTKRTLLLVDRRGQIIPVWKDRASKQFLASVELKREREVEFPKVRQYFTNGIEKLSETTWPGQFIPVVSCYGKVLYVTTGGTTKRVHISLPRLARDPAMLYCYYRSQEAEIAGMIPKAPVAAYEGQLDGYEREWAKAAHEPVAYLLFKGTTEATGNTILPPPSRVQYESGQHLQSLEVCAEGSRRAIQAAIGSTFLPTSAQRKNEKSGVALKQIEYASQKGSFHFIDHYDASLTRCGAILDDLIPHYDDTARDVTVRRKDDTTEIVRINDPADPKAITVKEHGKPVGLHDVTLSTGQSFDSEREAASDFADLIVSNPAIAQIIGPKAAAALVSLSIKLKNIGPLGEEMSDLVMPPEFKKDQQQQIPPEAQQALAQMQGQLQQVGAMLQEAQRKIETDAAKQQATIEKAKIDGELQIKLQGMKNACAIAVAHIAAASKGAALEAHAIEEQEAIDAQAQAADLSRQHEVAMASASHEAALQMGAQQHQQALEVGEQSHAQALEQSAQQADAALQQQQAAQQAQSEAVES